MVTVVELVLTLSGEMVRDQSRALVSCMLRPQDHNLDSTIIITLDDTF